MSNASQGSPMGRRRGAGKHDDFSRDLELLVQRLAESRGAIARLLAATAGEEGRPSEEPLRGPVALHSPLTTVGPATTERSHGPGPKPEAKSQALEGPEQADEALTTVDVLAGAAKAVRRRVFAAVFLAVGVVVLLPALVSIL